MQPRTVQVFVASPNDVRFERARLDRIVARLNGAFSKAAYFRCFRWEHEFYKAHKSFQDQIPEPAACDIVIVIFGTRLGTELPEDFEKRLPDGAPYPSGTAYELLSAVALMRSRFRASRSKSTETERDLGSTERGRVTHEGDGPARFTSSNTTPSRTMALVNNVIRPLAMRTIKVGELL